MKYRVRKKQYTEMYYLEESIGKGPFLIIGIYFDKSKAQTAKTLKEGETS